jgi:hypothetical protein
MTRKLSRNAGPFWTAVAPQRDTALLGTGSQRSPSKPPNVRIETRNAMEGGALRRHLRRQNTSEPLPRKAPSRFALPAHSKNFPLLAATRVVLAVPCFPQAVFPFRVFRACRGPIPRQRAAKKWQRSDSAPKLTMLGLLHAWRPCTQSLPPN